MLKYEYYVLNDYFESAIKMEETFNDLGRDGWCFVSQGGGFYIFRRPIDPNPEGEK